MSNPASNSTLILHAIRVITACAVLMVNMAPVAFIHAQELDAKVLLHKSRSQRLSIREGTAVYRIDYQWFTEEGNSSTDSQILTIFWKNDNLYRSSIGREKEERYDRLALLKNGELITFFRKDKRVLISDRDRHPGEIFFDPRGFGATIDTTISSPVSRLLFPDDTGAGEIIRKELVDGVECHLIKWRHFNQDAEDSIWISTSAPHNILRLEAFGIRYANRYENGCSIPRESTLTDHFPTGQLQYRNQYTLLEFSPRAEKGIQFDLADFDLPIGTPIVDLRLNMTVGFWNGREPVDNYFTALKTSGILKKATPPHSRKIPGFAIISIYVTGVCLCFLVLLRLRRKFSAR